MEGSGEMDQINVQIVPNYTTGTTNPFDMDTWSKFWKYITNTQEITNTHFFALPIMVPYYTKVPNRPKYGHPYLTNFFFFFKMDQKDPKWSATAPKDRQRIKFGT